MTTYDGF